MEVRAQFFESSDVQFLLISGTDTVSLHRRHCHGQICRDSLAREPDCCLWSYNY